MKVLILLALAGIAIGKISFLLLFYYYWFSVIKRLNFEDEF